MHWWAEHKMSYQIFSSVAQTLLCMPVTSVVSECLFLKAFDVIMCKRNTLAPSQANTNFSYGQSVTVASLG